MFEDTGGARRRAYHQAGHAVAAALRAPQTFDDCLLTLPASDAAAATDWGRTPPSVLPFVAYAGAWAQARAARSAPGTQLDDRRRFEDEVARVLLGHPHDAMAVTLSELDVATALRHAGAADDECFRWVRGVLFAWGGDLEDMWPVVEDVAHDLLAGRVVSVAQVHCATTDRLAALSC